MKLTKLTTLTLCLLALPLALGAQIVKQTENKLISPDGAYEFIFYQKLLENQKKQMYYTLSYKGKSVIEESELGVQIENQLFESALAVPNDTCNLWCEDLTLTTTERQITDETWKPVYGERSQVRDNYTQLTLKFRKGGDVGGFEGGYDKRRNYFMDIIVRAYNEGVALRYHFPEATNGLFLHITGEQTQFTLPPGTMAYYEQWAQGPYSLLPLQGWTGESERPLTLKLAGGLTVALLEAQMIDYARGKFRLSTTKPNTLQTSLYASVDAITPYSTPWRVIMAAERAATLINNNDLVLNLNDPCRIEDTSWIKPGKVFRVGLKQTDVLAGIDFAADRGIEYVHMDAGWYGAEMKMSSDATSVATDKDLDMAVLCKYAQSKGVGLMVYVNQRALVQQLDQLLPLYKQWGLKGIKFGFVQIGNQHWSTWLHEAIRKCAQYNMLVDIHDEYRPTGYSRTYPNLMTQEGIRGNEEMPDATHNTILPYTRYLAGAGDYTLCYFNNRVKNTHAHQLAMAAVYYSPLQFMYWYDTPALYKGEQELEFWKNIPTVWDDSRALEGEIGEYITQARRSASDWFVGAMTNTTARTVTIQTEFLDRDRIYTVTLYEDDDKMKTRTNVRITTKKVKAGDKLTLTLKASGGAALHFRPLDKVK